MLKTKDQTSEDPRGTVLTKVMEDRTGLRISFAELQPIDGEKTNEMERFWMGTIVMTSSQLELPEVTFKLRVNAKRGLNPKVTCNRSQGVVKQNQGVVVSYQLPESSIETIRMTLLVDGSPYEVPLRKNTTNSRHPFLNVNEESSPKIEQEKHLSKELKAFLAENNGLERVCKLLYPHAMSVFHELSVQTLENFNLKMSEQEPELGDAIAEEIVKRFNKGNLL